MRSQRGLLQESTGTQDDAADAKFWPIDSILDGELEMAGDHQQIIKNWLNL